MSKSQWKQCIFLKMNEKYPDMKEAQRKEMDRLLDEHWELNKRVSATIFSRVPAVFGSAGLASMVNLTAVLPNGAVAAVLGRSVFMALSFLASHYLSEALLQRVLPAIEKLEVEQLEGLFKKVDDMDGMIKKWKEINEDILRCCKEQDRDVKIQAAGAFVGAAIGAARLGTSSAQRGYGLFTVAGVYLAPAIVNRTLQKPKPEWQNDLPMETNHPGKSGLRRRNVGK